MRALVPIALLSAALLALAAVPAAAKDEREADADGKRPGFHAKGGKWVLQNDHIAVWFNAGKEKAKPDLRVALNSSGEDESSGYRVKILRLCEVPANGTQCVGNLPRMNLAKADDWNVVQETSGDELRIAMTRAEEQGVVTLVWRLDTVHATVKWDLLVDDWQWGNESNRLALDMLVQGKDLRNETGDRVRVEDSGYISWEPTAKASYPDGSSANLTVSASHKGGKADRDDEGETGAHLLLVFDGAGGYRSLVYDPTFGVQGSGTTAVATPGVGLALLVAAVGVLAVVRSSRRRMG